MVDRLFRSLFRCPQPGFRVLVGFLCAALCTGCPRRESRPATAPDGGADPLAILLAEQLQAELQFSPTTATWLGDHHYDDRLDDVREATVRAEVARLRQLLERLKRLAGELRDPAQALDLQLLTARIRGQLLELVDLRPHERSPLFYMNIVAHGIDGLLGPDFGEGRVRALSRRLKAVPELCREAQRNLKNPPELVVRRAVELGQATADFLGALLPRLLRSVATDKLLDEALRSSDEARRALQDFVGWLLRDQLPRARGEWALGREMLLARLHALELLDVPLELVLALGEQGVKETGARLEEAARGLAAGPRPVEAALRLLEEDHPRPENLLHSVKENLGALYAGTAAARLLTLPPSRPRVAEMPPYRWGYLTLHAPGPLETRTREAVLLVDPVDPGWTDKRRVQEHLRALNRTQQLLLLGHEVVPGRFVQQEVLRQHAGELSPVRQRTRSLAFVTGWAHYAEELVRQALPGAGPTEAGDRAPERQRLEVLRLRAQLLHLGRLVVTLRLHLGGGAGAQARLDDAARYLAEECALDDYTARREAERAAVDPMGLLPALGRLQLAKLLRDAQAQEGERFSLGAFHDRLLRQGELPVVALRQLLLSQPGPSLAQE